jgi:hypothetical protein
VFVLAGGIELNMAKLAWLAVIGCVFALAAPAASIDGKWVAEVKTTAGNKQGAAEQTTILTFDLKASAGALTGTVTAGGRRRDRTMNITEGKIDGDSFSFTTIQQSKKGEQKLEWRGTIQGDELKLTRGRPGARRGVSITGRRSRGRARRAFLLLRTREAGGSGCCRKKPALPLLQRRQERR